MPELNTIQTDLLGLRNTVASNESDLKVSKAQLQLLNQNEAQLLKGLSGQALEAKRNELNQQKETLANKIKNANTVLTGAKSHLHQIKLQAFANLNPESAANQLNDKYPILLFPLRLETRFKQTAVGKQLWLRVYPDDCNVSKPETHITATELKNTELFWVEFWKALGNEDAEKGAWRALVSSHGVGRASWLIHNYSPEEIRTVVGSGIQHVIIVKKGVTLSAAEIAALNTYWVKVWLSKGDAVALSLAESELTSVLTITPDKATELKTNYTPFNIDDTVPDGITADKIQVVVLETILKPGIEEVSDSWTEAPRMKAMPDKFVAILYSGTNKRSVLFSNPVRDGLAVGIDPMLEKEEQIKKDVNNDLVFNDDLKWMMDFDKAVEVGMGVKIDLNAQETISGFDKLFVLGLRFSSSPSVSAQNLEQLIEEHFYSKQGFELIKQGTPTNNTEDNPSGHSSEEDADGSYLRLFKNSEVFTETNTYWLQSDGQRLANSLNLNPALFKNKVNAAGKDQLEAYAMNTALFPATMGYFMEEMMDPIFNDRTIESTRFFVSRFVSGRGPIPAIKIGKQPYGILPVTTYSKIGFYERLSSPFRELGDAKSPYLNMVRDTVKRLDTTWAELSETSDYLGKSGDPHQLLLNVLGLHPNSVEFHQRYAQTIQQLFNELKLTLGTLGAIVVALAAANRGKTILQQIGLDPNTVKPPILDKFFLSTPNPLTGSLIDDVDSSETDLIRAYTSDDKNYLEWLISASGEILRTQNFGSGKAAPNAILYMLLRHSLLLAQSETATNLYLSKGIIRDKRSYFDQPFMHIQKTETGKSKFEHLYKPEKSITGSENKLLIDYIHEPSVISVLPEAKTLSEIKSALGLLKDTPTARLERLLIEHLDCCNYRLDAWRTGLVHYKLFEQQTYRKSLNAGTTPPEEGLYLGAYGWLENVKPKTTTVSTKQLPNDLEKIFNPDNKKTISVAQDNLGFIHAPSVDQAATAAILRNAYDSHKGSGGTNPFAINLNSERVRLANQFLEGIRNGQTLNALLGYQFERGLHEKYNLGQGEADVFIYPLRKAFPIASSNLNTTTPTTSDVNDAVSSNALPDNNKAIETIEANNVIDGLKLIEHIQKTGNTVYPFGLPASYNLPNANATQKAAISEETKRIMEIHDAISDMVMAEQVYQTVKGNIDRNAGVSEAFSKGSYPPDMDVVKTERSGVTLTHRIGVHFNPDASVSTSPNTVTSMTPRAALEPSVNEWLSTILPDPQNVSCHVVYSTPLAQNQSIYVSQADLGLQSIDLLFSTNFDAEQSMKELDDRIMHYVRHQVSLHPDTSISIMYTDSIDVSDASKISFFELGALLKRLRNILTTTKYLKPDALCLPTGEENEESTFNTSLLNTRITAVKTSLNIVKNSLKTNYDALLSIRHLKATLLAELTPHISDSALRSDLATQLDADLQSFLTNPTTDNKTTILNAFETAIAIISDATVKASLKVAYGDMLENYKSDFGNLDTQLKTISDALMSAALYDAQQTGTGFIHQAIGSVYDSTFALLDKVITRWEKKKADYETLIATYDPAGAEEEQLLLLQKAERLIAPRSTFPIPTPMNAYKNALDLKKNNFDAVLLDLKALKSNAKQTVTEFIKDVEAVTIKLPDHDIIPLDSDKNLKDLYTQKISLVQLKESVDTALGNEIAYLEEKLTNAQTALDAALAATSNSEQTELYLAAAKTILGDNALIVPQFVLAESKAAEIETVYTHHASLLTFAKDKVNVLLPVEDWLGGVARVREKAHDWEGSAMLVNAFRPEVELTLTPMQFPYVTDDRWLALQFKLSGEAFKPEGDKLLYTSHFATPYDKTKPVCGIVIDEWTEVLPAEEETTGLVFHYDQPNSEPPQTMLLMVPPVFNGEWDWNNMVLTLEETLDAAKKRAVEPAQIDTTAYAQFLPTTISAVTTHMISVAMNLSQNNVTMPKTN